VHESADTSEGFRAKLMWTTALAVVLVALLTVACAVAVKVAWLSTPLAAVIIAAGSVLVSIAALSWVYFLSYSLRPAHAAFVPVRKTAEHWDESLGAGAVNVAGRPALPPPITPWPQFAEHGSPTFGGSPTLRREVFGKLAYRLQSLVNRLIHRIDQVEQEIEDPELLKSLYGIDHLATRIRRQIENLAVLGGEAPQRRSNIPVDVNAVLRAAVSEIEHYKQVTTVPIRGAKIHGHVVAEIIHLLAELLENATTFTAADAPKVMLRAHYVTAGLAIQVQDRGIGMSHEDIARLNRLLNGTTQVDVGQLLQDGRIGLAVVEILARRHNIGAELQPNIFGGTDASIVIPHSLLSERHRMPVPAPRTALPAPARQDLDVTATSSAKRQAPTAAPRPSPTSATPIATQPQLPSQALPYPQSPVEVGPVEVSQALFGSTEPAQPAPNTAAGNHGSDQQQDDKQHQSPALPVRRRGETYSQLRSGVAAEAVITEAGLGAGSDDVAASSSGTVDNRYTEPAANQSDRPALPQRRGSHLREELRDPPAAVRPIPGHNPTLMSALQEGRARGRAELAAQESSQRGSQQQPPQAHDTEGDSV
jgi:signal transduction histidine kinase